MKTDWNLVIENAKNKAQQRELELNYLFSDEEIDEKNMKKQAIFIRDLILSVIKETVSKKNTSEFSKPWWNSSLTNQRKRMAQKKRQWQKHQIAENFESYQKERNEYFSVIKNAKSKYWNNFLENA